MKLVSFVGALAACLAVPGVALAQWGQPASGSGSQGQYGSQPDASGSGGSMQAGGLAPPSSSEDPESAQTEQKLETADEKDSGRGLEWVWLNGEIGFEHLGLQTFKANHLLDSGVVKTTQTGLAYGAGLGVRLVFLTLGARFRLASFDQYQVWTLGGEVGLRIPLGNLEPYLTLGGGFASLGSFSAGDLGGVSGSNVSVKGYDIRAGGGLDYYVTPVFSVGASITGEMLGLTRPGVDPSKLQQATSGTVMTPAGAQATSGQIYAADGSSLGFGVTGTAVLGLHF